MTAGVVSTWGVVEITTLVGVAEIVVDTVSGRVAGVIVGLVVGIVLVDRNVIVEVRVMGIVDFVEPIEITVDVTGHVVVVMVTITVVEPLVFTDSVMTAVDGWVIGMVFVDRRVVVEVSVMGIVDFVEPIETTVEVTGHVVVVMVTICVVEPMVSTELVITGVDCVTIVMVLGKMGVINVVNDVDDSISVVFLVTGIVLVVTKVVVEVKVMGTVDVTEPREIIVEVTGQVVVVIVMTSVVELIVSIV